MSVSHIQVMSARKLLLSAIPLLVLACMAIGLGSADAARGVITVADGEFGETVTATVNPGGSLSRVYVACEQDGDLVFGTYYGVDENNHALLTLGPSMKWTGGDADCTAQEGYYNNGGKWHVLAETSFHVYDSTS